MWGDRQEGPMAESKKAKSQGELDREKELANRKAREELAKSQPNLIDHGPARK